VSEWTCWFDSSREHLRIKNAALPKGGAFFVSAERTQNICFVG